MHWGHAISKDLINWVHQPLFLIPTFVKDETDRSNWGEHFLSGSAIPYGEHGVRAFVTNYKNGGRAIKAMQQEVISESSIKPDKHTVIVEEYPNAVLQKKDEKTGKRIDIPLKFRPSNFRDPGVFRHSDGHYYMTVGTQDIGDTDVGRKSVGGVILLYRTEKPEIDSKWKYHSVLVTDNRDGFENIECPGLFHLGVEDYYVLIYGREWGNVDNIHRHRDTLMLLGKFDGTNFEKISERTLDFAFGSYGHQGFYDEKGKQALLLGWQSWWNDWDTRSGFFSSESLPRIVKMSNDNRTLLVGPHPNVLSQLRGNKMHADKGQNGHLLFKISAERRTAYIRLKIDQRKNKHKNVYVKIEHEKYKMLGVKINEEGLELQKDLKFYEKDTMKNTRKLIAAGANPDILHIFIDIDSLDIYGELKSEGLPRWCGTTRLTGNGEEWVRSVEIQENGADIEVEAWEMKPAKMLGNIHNNGAWGQNKAGKMAVKIDDDTNDTGDGKNGRGSTHSREKDVGKNAGTEGK